MKTIYLVRHGEKQKLLGDPGLTPLGHQQAEATAVFLSQFPITQILSSPFLRAQETANHLSEKLKIQAHTTELLRERMNWGDDPTKTMSEFLEIWLHTSEDRDFTPQGGDSSRTAGKRLEQVVETLQTTQDEHIALITHGGVIADFLQNVFSTHELDAKRADFSHSKEFSINECSITTVRVEGGKYRLASLVSCDHLADLQ